MHEHLRHVRSPEDEAVVEAYLKQTVDVGQLMSNFLLEKAKAHVAYQKQCQALALQARKRLSEAKDQANWQLNELSPLMRACDTVLGGAEKEALEYGQYADSLLDVANAMTQSLKGREEAIKLLLQQRAELDKELAAADKDLLQLKKANDGAMHALLVARKNVDRAQASSGKTDRAGLKEETAFEFKRTTHNDYLLGITRANTMRTKLLSFDVVEILDSLEDTHARTVADISKLFRDVTQLHHSLYSTVAQQQEHTMQGVESCNMGCELSAWLNSFTPAPCTPPPVAEFEAPPVLSTQQQQQQQQQQQKKDRPKDRKDLPSDETSSSATEGNSGSTKAGRDKQQKTKDREEEEEDKGKGDAVWLRPQIVVSKKGRANDEYITKTTGRIAGEVSGLATTIGEQTALLEGVNRIYHEYRNQPHFGRADDVLPDLYKHKHEVRANHTRMQCCHAQLAVLEGISLQTALRRSIRRRSSRRTRTRAHARTHAHTHTRARAIAEENADDDDDDDEDDDDDDEGEESEDWDDDDDDDDGDHDDDHHDGGGGVETRVVDSPDLSSGAHVSAVVMFDYLGETKEHISVQSGDVVKLHECVDDGWWRVGHGDAVGLVPRSYLAAFVGNPRKLARTLYAYTAAAEGELSFEADRLIRVTKWNAAPGWTEGEYNGQRGVFPSSYIDRLHTA